MRIRDFALLGLGIILFCLSATESKMNVCSNSAADYDVCIYGGTSAGIAAALAIRRLGKRVLVIEPKKHIGGLSAGGLGKTDIGYRYALQGIAREFHRKLGNHYGRLENFTFEPHVAEKVFLDWVEKEEIPVMYRHRIVGVSRNDLEIESIEVENIDAVDTDNNQVIKAKIFLDCTYEGDLMARAGISYAVGREDNSIYGETKNGVQPTSRHQFPDGIDPYRIPGDSSSGLVWGVSNHTMLPPGTGDKKIQAYCFRLCLTTDPDNRIPIERPAQYDSSRYELLLRNIQKADLNRIDDEGILIMTPMPNSKTDINSGYGVGMSTDYVMGSWAYPEANYNEREKIWQDHVDYTKGLLYFLKSDERLPLHMRQEMDKYGYPKDEYIDNDGFTHELYVREARRMIGEYVMTEHNCVGSEIVEDGIALASYNMDAHHAETVIVDGMVKNEGEVTVHLAGPYPVSYRSIVPKSAECSNLLVPVCLSASHIAFGSIRMEPVFMALGQAAGMAAVAAIEEDRPVQDINIIRLIEALDKDPYLTGQEQDKIYSVFDEGVIQEGQWEQKSEKRWSSSVPYLFSAPDDVFRALSIPISVARKRTMGLHFYNPKNSSDLVRGEVGILVEHASGQDTIYVDLSLNQTRNLRMISLGTYSFTPSDPGMVKIFTNNKKLALQAESVIGVPVGSEKSN